MTAQNATDTSLAAALMTLLRDHGLLHAADGASDGSWIVRRTARGPQFVLDAPLDVIEYALDILLDVRLTLA